MKVASIRIDGGTQPRAEINYEAVAEYVEALRDGDIFPPVVVFFDGVDHWLADGFHRYHAHRDAKMENIAVDIREGSKRDAIFYSFGANQKHGLRRSNADKRCSVEGMLNDPEWGQMSDNSVAKHCGVSQGFVSTIRRALTSNVTDGGRRTYTDKHGNVSTMNVSAIGGKSPGRPKSAARLAKEARNAESEERAKDILDGFDPVKELDLANQQNEALIEENTALKADDTKAELAKQIELRRISDRLSHSQTDTIHEMDKELRRFIAWFKEIRQLTGTDNNTKAMAAIRIAFARSA